MKGFEEDLVRMVKRLRFRELNDHAIAHKNKTLERALNRWGYSDTHV